MRFTRLSDASLSRRTGPTRRSGVWLAPRGRSLTQSGASLRRRTLPARLSEPWLTRRRVPPRLSGHSLRVRTESLRRGEARLERRKSPAICERRSDASNEPPFGPGERCLLRKGSRARATFPSNDVRTRTTGDPAWQGTRTSMGKREGQCSKRRHARDRERRRSTGALNQRRTGLAIARGRFHRPR
jgi:hypothetical protein